MEEEKSRGGTLGDLRDWEGSYDEVSINEI